MLTNSELRAKARAALGGNIFATAWLMALLVCLVIVAANLVGCIPAVGTIASIIISGAVTVGVQGYFLSTLRGNNVKFVDVFNGFKNDFVGNFLLGFMSSLFLTLWTLLFIIPGIIKSYSYSMAFYIKNDHPEYSWNECITASREMMDGNKWRLFCLQFSFIGWSIVAMLVPFGSMFLAPYTQMATAAFYEELKANS